LDLKHILPFVQVRNHIFNSCLGFQWTDPDTIWSVSKDRTFCISDINAAFRPASVLTTSSIAWNVYGDLGVAADGKARGQLLMLPEALLVGGSDTSSGISASPLASPVGTMSTVGMLVNNSPASAVNSLAREGSEYMIARKSLGGDGDGSGMFGVNCYKQKTLIMEGVGM
jgi:hypothetical protein